MHAADAGGLSPEHQEALERWLREFDRTWEEGALARRSGELPSDAPWRLLALAGMVKSDLRHSWQAGYRKLLESYLNEFPELGTPDTVPLDLIQTEMQVRRQAGDPVSWSDLARRFPKQTEQLRRGLEQLYSKPTSPPPIPPDPTPPPLPPAPATLTAPTSPATMQASAIPPPIPPLQEEESLSGLNTLRPGDSEPDLNLANEPTRRAASPNSRYEILKELGRGSMGTVYLVMDTFLQRQVAMKVPLFRPDDSPELLERFRREARAAATLNHPNICPVYDVGESEGRPYLTMAFIEGEPLTQVVRRERPMDTHRAVTIIKTLAGALEEAHCRGIIHRDLKPSNVMMNNRGEPVVMDFGLARRIDQDVRLTSPGAVLGTPAYMSPEQVRGDLQIGPRSDIYSLGVMLYEMLAGQVPFRGPVGGILHQILNEKPRPPHELRADLDPQLEAVCLKAMAFDAADRYATMAEFAEALDRFAFVANQDLPSFITETDHEAHFAQSTIAPPTTPGPPTPWGKRILVGGLVVVLLSVLGGLGYLVWLVLQPGPPPVTITIQSEPSGATILIDGTKQERLTEAKLSLRPGTYQVELKREGHRPLLDKLVVQAGDEGKVFRYPLEAIPVLQPGTVTVHLDSKPSGATVLLHGEEQARLTPLKIPLRPGKYQVDLQKDGYEPLTNQTIEVAAGQRQLIVPPFVLKRLTGTLEVTTEPPGATVMVNGQKHTQLTPTTLQLDAGTEHKLQLSKSGYVTQTATVVVKAGEKGQKLHRDLEPDSSDRYALLVGVRRSARNLPDFIHAEPDVDQLGRLLIAGGYQPDKVVVLTETRARLKGQEGPTAETIRRALQTLKDRCRQGDSLLVALVGHAAQPPDGKGPVYFCPVGAVLKEPQTLLPLQEVYDQMLKCRARTRVLVLDCWRQDLRKDPAPLPPQVGRGRPALVLPTEVVSVWLSCSAGEQGYIHPEQRHGAFFASLLRKLLAPDEGTLANLAAAVQAEVVELTRKEYKRVGKPQTPQLQGGPPTEPRPALRLDGVLAQYRRGIEHLEKAAQLKPGKGKLAEYDQAIKALKDAIETDGGFVEAHTRLAEALYRRGLFEEAAAAARQAAELTPTDPTAHSYRADALARLKQFPKALDSHDEAIKLEPSYANEFNGCGYTHYLAGEYQDAINQFGAAERLNPRLKEVYNNRGFAYLKFFASLKNPKYIDLAITDQKEALDLDKDFVPAWHGRARAYFDKGDYKLARNDLKGAKAEYNQALSDLKEAIRRDPSYIPAYVLRANVHDRLGNSQEAAMDRATAEKLRKQAGQ
ncbi:MAG: PEGA domain-containing protein [Gemmataceae bacterium]|nr:PEGA domain-containing protein [Gemmataceae bacterium]